MDSSFFQRLIDLTTTRFRMLSTPVVSEERRARTFAILADPGSGVLAAPSEAKQMQMLLDRARGLPHNLNRETVMKLLSLSSTLQRRVTGRATLLATVVFVLFTALVLPRQAAEAEGASNGAGSPDTAFWYTPTELYQIAEAYGPAGRQAYIKARWTFDLVWPVVYTVFLSLTISWVYRRAFSAESRWQLANLAPAAGMLLDYLENSATSLVMARYPALTPGIAHLAPVFTLTKWVFVNGSFILLLIGVIATLWRRSAKAAG